MNPREVIRIALRALARNKLRTILTMLGIIIGVGAVICTVAIGQGASQQVQQQIQALGTNIIMVFSGNVNVGGPPTTRRRFCSTSRVSRRCLPWSGPPSRS